jgi:hypothetical protein
MGKRRKEPANKPTTVDRTTRPLPIIKVVGISAAGKSTLVASLRAAGYDARPVSQEHANVADLWRHFETPRALIYLDVTLEGQRARRTDVTWSEEARDSEVRKLAHARTHADLVINTTALSPAIVLTIVTAWLGAQKVRRANTPLPPIGATGAPVADNGPSIRPTT